MSLKPGRFTAMISSTALDLPGHRKAVEDACLAAGVFPIGMEHSPARDASGITESLKMVDDADILVGIYAWRYGCVPEGHDISITEMEFDRAVERKAAGQLREILIFTACDDPSFSKDNIEDNDVAQRKLAAFKAKASAGRVRKEFHSAEDLEIVVGNALQDFVSRHQTADFCNLPNFPPFFGREEELQKIHEALDPSSGTWGTLIEGEGGRGKTALAVHAAERYEQGDQFSRIIFLSARQRAMDEAGLRAVGGFSQRSWRNIRNEIGKQLNQPQIAKEPEETRTSLLCEKLTNSRSLIILDNLETIPKEDLPDLRNFLENLPRDCKALLTSRTSLGLTSERLALPKLDRVSALKCLDDLAKHNERLADSSEDDRIRLYDETHGNSLLLRWVAGQVGQEDRTTLDDALAFLGTCPSDNDPLDFIFGDLLRSLSDANILVLAALTHPTQPIPVEAIAEIAGSALDDSRRMLKILANRSLVVSDKQQNSYALVPMVAGFLRKQRPDVVRETGNRLEQRAYALIVENGYQEHERFPVLDAAWPTVAPALPLFLAGPNDRLQTVCSALEYFMEFTGRWDDRLSLCKAAEAKAQAAGDENNAGERAHERGWIHYLRREADKVLSCAEKELKHRDAAHAGASDRASAIRLRGLGYRLKQDYAAAITDYGTALDLYATLPAETQDVAIVLNYRGEVERLSGDFESAERDFLRSLEVAKTVGFDEGVACYTGDLAQLALDQQNFEHAEKVARIALELSKTVGRQELIADASHRLAIALVNQDKAAEALPYVNQAVEIYTKLRSPDLADAEATLARCEAHKE